ncbi:MAG: hypothetical protein KBG28_05260 [Kofleriaceae bacterium]|nr:hypothetical protein [Kofleriaceae bacterium]MBP6837952.1 hypothetical protein [Kofleriaceae bacterium]MBP9203353.1 hypothetical protein [Kofleriaceae bacterium]
MPRPWLPFAALTVTVALAVAPGPAGAEAPSTPLRTSPTVIATAGPTRAPAPRLVLGGRYDSTYGTVELTRDGDQVFGRYECCGKGSLRGRIVGRRVFYTWREDHAGEAATGHGVWTLGADGRLTGTWGWGKRDDDGGAWDLWQAPRPTSAIAR